MKNKINFTVLYNLYQTENSFIGATLKYINDRLDIDIDEFDFKELPPEWKMLLEKEAKSNNMFKKDTATNSFERFLKR